MTSDAGLPSGRILLVEDDPMIRALTAEWVEDAGFEVSEVGSGREAVDQMRDGAGWRAAILDLTLPDTDGQTLARDLRRIDPGLPILFATGNPHLVAEAPRGPVADILRKPYSTRDLHAALRQLLGAPAG